MRKVNANRLWAVAGVLLAVLLSNLLTDRVVRAFLLMMGVCLAPSPRLLALSPPAWPVLHSLPAVAGQLNSQVWPSDTDWAVYLKNTGSVTLYFQLSFRGLPSTTPKSPRVQLDPKSARAEEMDEVDYLPEGWIGPLGLVTGKEVEVDLLKANNDLLAI